MSSCCIYGSKSSTCFPKWALKTRCNGAGFEDVRVNSRSRDASRSAPARRTEHDEEVEKLDKHVEDGLPCE